MSNITFRYILLLFLLAPISNQAQVSGKVQHEDGQPLAFASIYVQGTTKGTTSNLKGEYFLNLEKGEYTLVFQYVGFKTKEANIQIDEEPVLLEVTMVPETYELDEVVISADAEDPAYEIIRKAIAKRKYYLENIEAYECDVYIKGNQKLLKAPEKILGQEIGDMEGILDSNRQGIVYLSESLARYYFKAPDSRKEVMISSKISGNDRGYSFNNATELEVNFYENTVDFNRQLVSPIADNALNYYNYRLLGAEFDNDGRLINKIKVIPRRKFDPAVNGTIYIVEDLWNIQSLELSAGPRATQLYFLDSLTVKQVHVPVGEPDQWRIFSVNISFDLSLFGFELEGQFTGVYTNYNLSPHFNDDFFDADLLVVQEESNQKTDEYWHEIRPVPLLHEEVYDYHRRDSLQRIWDSEEYKDSIDRKNNKFGFSDILGKYEYSNTKNLFFLDIESPIGNTSFNTVQGYHMSLAARVLKYYDEDRTNRILIWPKISYGFSEKKIRPHLRFEYRFNRLSSTVAGFEGGETISAFNDDVSISDAWNSIYSLFFKRNYLKIFDKKHVRIFGQQELFNGAFLNLGFEFADRSALINLSDYSFFYENSRTYSSNDPLQPETFGDPSFEDHQIFRINVDFRFRPGQKYYRYPKRKFAVQNSAPALLFHYDSGIRLLGGDVSFHHFSLGMEGDLEFGARGELRYHLAGGKIFTTDALYFMDYKHFRGQQILMLNPISHNDQFLLLPYFSHSTDEKYLESHIEYNFKGWILDKIPPVNHLGWSLVTGANYLKIPDRPYYWEVYVGLDQIGISFLRLIRVDFVFAFENGEQKDFGVRLGIKL